MICVKLFCNSYYFTILTFIPSTFIFIVINFNTVTFYIS